MKNFHKPSLTSKEVSMNTKFGHLFTTITKIAITIAPIRRLPRHIPIVLLLTNIQFHFLIFTQVLKVWELTDHTCVQTVIVPFPTSLHGRLPEHGAFPLHLQLGPGNHSLLLTANDYLASLKVSTTNSGITHCERLFPLL